MLRIGYGVAQANAVVDFSAMSESRPNSPWSRLCYLVQVLRSARKQEELRARCARWTCASCAAVLVRLEKLQHVDYVKVSHFVFCKIRQIKQKTRTLPTSKFPSLERLRIRSLCDTFE